MTPVKSPSPSTAEPSSSFARFTKAFVENLRRRTLAEGSQDHQPPPSPPRPPLEARQGSPGFPPAPRDAHERLGGLSPETLDDLFDVVTAYGEATVSMPGVQFRPSSRLRHSKETIKAALIALHCGLASPEIRATIRSRYAAEFANHVLSESYRGCLATGLGDLAAFVADNDAAQANLVQRVLEASVGEKKDLDPVLRLSDDQWARVRELNEAAAAEAQGYLEDLTRLSPP